MFTEPWKRSAPNYDDRARQADDTILALSRSSYHVTESIFRVGIGDPFRLPRMDLRRAVRSVLCNADVGSNPESELFAWVRDVLRRHGTGDSIQCESVCYEIARFDDRSPTLSSRRNEPADR